MTEYLISGPGVAASGVEVEEAEEKVVMQIHHGMYVSTLYSKLVYIWLTVT